MSDTELKDGYEDTMHDIKEQKAISPRQWAQIDAYVTDLEAKYKAAVKYAESHAKAKR